MSGEDDMMIGDGRSERTPLIGGNQPPPPDYSLYPSRDFTGETSAQRGSHTISCDVCLSSINIEGRANQHAVKCTNCNEFTAINDPPPGKKYVRCPCNCLLSCSSTSPRVSCPRENCKRVLTLDAVNSPTVDAVNSVNSPVVAVLAARPTLGSGPQDVFWIRCGHCQQTFLWNSLTVTLRGRIRRSKLARCPHCEQLSSVGEYIKCYAVFVLFLGLLGLAGGITCVILLPDAIYVAVLCFVSAAISLGYGLFYCCLKQSTVEERA